MLRVMASIPGWYKVRQNSTRYGMLTVAAGLILLIALRIWASPVARAVTDRARNGLVEFLLIPVFLVVVTVGVLLFLWEPDTDHDAR